MIEERYEATAVTLDDVLRDEGRVEVCDGAQFEMPESGSLQRIVISNLLDLMAPYVRAHDARPHPGRWSHVYVFSAHGVRVFRGEDSIDISDVIDGLPPIPVKAIFEIPERLLKQGAPKAE